jgi:hypothetical protein
MREARGGVVVKIPDYTSDSELGLVRVLAERVCHIAAHPHGRRWAWTPTAGVRLASSAIKAM